MAIRMINEEIGIFGMFFFGIFFDRFDKIQGRKSAIRVFHSNLSLLDQASSKNQIKSLIICASLLAVKRN